MAHFRDHAAGCCGVKHIHGFTRAGPWHTDFVEPTVEHINTLLRRHNIPAVDKARGKCVEAVITDSQFKQDPALAQTMVDLGFKLKTRFYNNTGGMCNVLHRTTGERDLKRAAQRLPFLRTLLEAE